MAHNVEKTFNLWPGNDIDVRISNKNIKIVITVFYISKKPEERLHLFK